MRAIPVLMAMLVIAGLYLWVGAPIEAENGAPSAPSAHTPAMPPVAVVAFHSEARPVQSAVLMRGRTEAFRLVDLRAETAGLVASQPMRAGAAVAKGDVLCRLAPGSREAELEQARAALMQAEADARAADTLAQRGLTAENTAMARRAAQQSAAAAVRRAELDLARLEIVAPFDGVLETDAAEIGGLLRIGDVCARLIALDPIKIVGFAPETEVNRLRPGLPAFARLVTGQQVAGEISFVSRSSDETTRTFRVEVTAPNSDGQVRDGVTADIAVPMAGGTAHFVPQAALTLNDEGALGVRIVEDGRAAFRKAEIVREEVDGLWLDGLPDRADIIYVGHEFVSDGRAVAPTYEDWSAAQ